MAAIVEGRPTPCFNSELEIGSQPNAICVPNDNPGIRSCRWPDSDRLPSTMAAAKPSRLNDAHCQIRRLVGGQCFACVLEPRLSTPLSDGRHRNQSSGDYQHTSGSRDFIHRHLDRFQSGFISQNGRNCGKPKACLRTLADGPLDLTRERAGEGMGATAQLLRPRVSGVLVCGMTISELDLRETEHAIVQQ